MSSNRVNANRKGTGINERKKDLETPDEAQKINMYAIHSTITDPQNCTLTSPV